MSVTDYLEQQRTVSFDAAEEAGLDVVTPAENEIQLDIDRPWPLDVDYIHRDENSDPADVFALLHEPIFSNLHATLERVFTDYFTVMSCQAWKSHGGNTHVVLTLTRDLSPQTRIALQATLGSDPIRELLNLVRVENDCRDPIALFRPRTGTTPRT